MTLNVIFDIGPFVRTFLEGFLVALFDDIKAQINDLKAAAASEHEQVMAALAALEAKIGESLTPDQVSEIAGLFAETRQAIIGVYEPPVVEPPAE